MKALQWDWSRGPFLGGVTLYPYQVALGVSFAWWPCIRTLSLRLHIGPFKVWVGVRLGGSE